MTAQPTLHVIAGPNGAGKSTLYEFQIQRLTDAEFVNADILAKAKFGHAAVTEEESRAGQEMAEARREELLAARESMVVESTFSHPSKVDFVRRAKGLGYRVVLYHVNVRTPEHAVERVRFRVSDGGHPVPENRIVGRYSRNQPLIREAVLVADRAYVFDNSAKGHPPTLLMQFAWGKLVARAPDLPTWARELYGDDL